MAFLHSSSRSGTVLALIAFFGLSVSAVPAHAAKTGISEAHSAHRDVIGELSRGKTQEVASATLDVLVGEGMTALKASGNGALAKKLEGEWQRRYQHPLTAADFPEGFPVSGFMDLGDHTPLSQWLANYYETLSTKTRGVIRTVRVIEDLNTLNYALAVVFAPRGSWQSGLIQADRIEYRKHFVPFSKIVSYWLSYEGCEYACKKYASWLEFVCKPSAESIEWFVGRHVAWQISDAIYSLANGFRGVNELGNPEFPIMSEEELERQVERKVGQLQ